MLAWFPRFGDGKMAGAMKDILAKLAAFLIIAFIMCVVGEIKAEHRFPWITLKLTGAFVGLSTFVLMCVHVVSPEVALLGLIPLLFGATLILER